MSSRSNPDDELYLRYKMLIKMLYTGYQEADRAVKVVGDKAKTTIAVGAVILSIIIAGTRVLPGLLNESAGGGNLMAQASPLYGVSTSTLTGWGIVMIMASIVVSFVAIGIIRLNNPFGSQIVLTKGKLDQKKINMWSTLPRKYAYETICEVYARAIRNRERASVVSGMTTLAGQAFLGVGLVMVSIAAIGLFGS